MYILFLYTPGVSPQTRPTQPYNMSSHSSIGYFSSSWLVNTKTNSWVYVLQLALSSILLPPWSAYPESYSDQLVTDDKFVLYCWETANE